MRTSGAGRFSQPVAMHRVAECARVPVRAYVIRKRVCSRLEGHLRYPCARRAARLARSPRRRCLASSLAQLDPPRHTRRRGARPPGRGAGISFGPHRDSRGDRTAGHGSDGERARWADRAPHGRAIGGDRFTRARASAGTRRADGDTERSRTGGDRSLRAAPLSRGGAPGRNGRRGQRSAAGSGCWGTYARPGARGRGARGRCAGAGGAARTRAPACERRAASLPLRAIRGDRHPAARRSCGEGEHDPADARADALDDADAVARARRKRARSDTRALRTAPRPATKRPVNLAIHGALRNESNRVCVSCVARLPGSRSRNAPRGVAATSNPLRR